MSQLIDFLASVSFATGAAALLMWSKSKSKPKPEPLKDPIEESLELCRKNNYRWNPAWNPDSTEFSNEQDKKYWKWYSERYRKENPNTELRFDEYIYLCEAKVFLIRLVEEWEGKNGCLPDEILSALKSLKENHELLLEYEFMPARFNLWSRELKPEAQKMLNIIRKHLKEGYTGRRCIDLIPRTEEEKKREVERYKQSTEWIEVEEAKAT